MAGAILYLDKDWPKITAGEKGTVVSIGLFAATFGSLLSGLVSDKFGRKVVIILSNFLFATGVLVIGFTDSIWMLYAGRIISGTGVGVIASAGPAYISEVAPVELRGVLVTVYVFFQVFGQLLVGIFWLFVGSDWRLMFGLAVIPAVVQLIAMLFMPESPRWLAK